MMVIICYDQNISRDLQVNSMPLSPKKLIKKLVKKDCKNSDEYFNHLDELEDISGHPDVEIYLEAAQERGLVKPRQLWNDMQSEAELYRRLIDDN